MQLESSEKTGPEFKLEKQLGARPPGAEGMGMGLDFILSALGSH